MVYRNFKELIEKVQGYKKKKKVAVAAAADEHTLEAVFKARENNIADPILIGDGIKINEILVRLGFFVSDESIIDIKDDVMAAYKAVELARKGVVDFMMKGKIQTADLLKAVVDKEKGLRTGSLMFHFCINEVPSYHKMLVVTDSGMVTNPDLEQKKHIIQGSVGILLSIGYDKPKVAVLAAVETVNPKMPETIDGLELKRMNQRGEIVNCIVEGPISYDLSVNRESAVLKGYESPVAGDADILVTPDIAAGNILGKCLVNSANAKMAGFIVGAKVPIVLTSRGSSTDEKYHSIVLSAAAV